MPDEPSLHDILRGSLAHHAEHLGDPAADIGTVWSRVDRRRARRRGIAVVGSVVAVAAGAAGILLVANPNGSQTPLDGSDGSAALAWACTGPLGSDGTSDYFETCLEVPRPVAASTTPVSIVGSTIADTAIASVPVLSAPPIGTAPPTTAFSPFVGQQHVVVEGDSVYGIGAQFGVEPEALADYNGWPEGINRPLVIGEQVQIPPTEVATVSTIAYAEQQHVVVPGDSLTAIAERYGVDLNDLANYNAWPEGLGHVIQPGEVVLIPPGGAAPLAPQCVTPTAPPTVPDGVAAPPSTTAPPGTITCVTYPPPTAPPTLAPVGSVTVWTGPTCAPTTTTTTTTTYPPPAGESGVSVPCGSVPDGFATGLYRCTGLLGADELYRYYTSCELTAPAVVPGTTAPARVPASTITFPGTIAAALTTTTTTTTTTLPPPVAASTVPAVATVVDREQLYVAVDGDSLTSIAERYGIDVDTLVAYNDWAEGIEHPLVVDETVKIPPGAIVLDLG